MYHPRLIENLSKEAYDLYLIRDTVCESLLELIHNESANYEQIKEFIKQQIDKNKDKIKHAKDQQDKDYLQLTIDS